MPPGQVVPGIPPAVAAFLGALETYDSAFEAGEVAREFGVRLTPLEETVSGQLVNGAAAH